jgi:hypothetical protein
MFHLLRFCTPAVIGYLLAAIAGCGSPVKSVTVVPQPKILQPTLEAVPSLNATVTKLVFFASGPSDVAPLKDPVYKRRFEHTTTTRIHPEIHLRYPPPGKRLFFNVTVHIRENGKTFRIVDYESRIEPDWTSSSHSVDIGVFGPGNWQAGAYEADVHINGDKVATGYFEIY